MKSVRNAFTTELRKILGIKSDDQVVQVDSTEFGDLRRRPKFTNETMTKINKALDFISYNEDHCVAN